MNQNQAEWLQKQATVEKINSEAKAYIQKVEAEAKAKVKARHGGHEEKEHDHGHGHH